jgi:hypothetical protein
LLNTTFKERSKTKLAIKSKEAMPRCDEALNGSLLEFLWQFKKMSNSVSRLSSIVVFASTYMIGKIYADVVLKYQPGLKLSCIAGHR